MNPFSMELLNNIVMRIWRNLWNLSSTLDGILSGPSDLVGLRVLSLLYTDAGVMTTSGKHTPTVISTN